MIALKTYVFYKSGVSAGPLLSLVVITSQILNSCNSACGFVYFFILTSLYIGLCLIFFCAVSVHHHCCYHFFKSYTLVIIPYQTGIGFNTEKHCVTARNSVFIYREKNFITNFVSKKFVTIHIICAITIIFKVIFIIGEFYIS